MAGLLSIGYTGITAAQANLLTTSHNITNAGTPGFNRQAVVLTTNEPQFSGSGFFGQGSRIDAIRRQYDQFLNQQVLSASARKEELAAYNTAIEQINNLLADESAGLSSALSGFFRGVNDVANNPSSIPARQAMISLAEALAGRFEATDTRLREIRDVTEGQIASTVAEINGYARQIAALNQRIGEVQVAGPTVQANDLLDQRDNLVAELNKLVRVSANQESDGSLSVFMGSGQPLVVGFAVTNLKIDYPDPADPFRGQVYQETPGIDVLIPDSVLQGGRLGGLLAFRNESLDSVRDQLGEIAKAISAEFNTQHGLGVDLAGAAGTNFFTDLTAVSARDAAASFAVQITDPALIAASSTVIPGAGNNENALALAALQTSKLMNGGTATFQSAYSQLVSSVGNKAREVQIAAKAQDVQYEQALAARESLSGVNLDEEAANLIRFQQSYQAASRVMAMAGTLFDEILGIVR
ncbi:MAG: flagellar hook-associated protein FlgK [Rhodocyclaceae bacterium]|jgi:flagellar hook-associated protein 1 FlgK|nr:flagellar hook-associated protein FlgK [Rhodocyclaceae bacterium]MCL4759008.1 flagellar hook-associated protein FlgK [Rhodocyclaceae bacterium]